MQYKKKPQKRAINARDKYNFFTQLKARLSNLQLYHNHLSGFVGLESLTSPTRGIAARNAVLCL